VSKNEIYRIKKGELSADAIVIPFEFGIILSDDGLLHVDLYIEEDFNLSSFIENKNSRYWDKEYLATCITEENNKIEIDRLSFTSIEPHFSKVKLVCYGKLTHTTIKKHYDEKDNSNPKLHYLELEGLNIEFCDITEVIRARRSQINDYNYQERDHTSAPISSNKFLYNQVFYKDEATQNIIVEFPNETNSTLYYSRFQEIRRDYVYALSFLNGAEVKIRKECTGSYYSMNKVDSEIVITYSFKKHLNLRFNKYLPICNAFYRSENVLSKFLIFNFDNYCDWNNKIDLNSIVYYLNSSEQARTMEEKVFIQMIAFERLTTFYAQYLGNKEEFIPCKEDFDPIKTELIQVIEKYKSKFGNAFNTAKSKISNINQIKRLSTTDKMYRILTDCDIPINDSIERLIEQVRHKTIHEGNIGNGEEAFQNLYLLDELLREIILRLVKYNGKRNSKTLINRIQSTTA